MTYEKSDSGAGDILKSPTSPNEVGLRLDAIISLYRTKREAADVAGVSTDQLARYVKGQNSASFEVLARLAAGKGVRLDWLATGQGPMRQEDAADQPGLNAPSKPVDEDLYGRVTEAVSTVYRECGYTATLRQVAARAARIAASITAAGGTPDQQAYGLRLSIDQLRTELRQAVADPAGAVSGKSRV